MLVDLVNAEMRVAMLSRFTKAFTGFPFLFSDESYQIGVGSMLFFGAGLTKRKAMIFIFGQDVGNPEAFRILLVRVVVSVALLCFYNSVFQAAVLAIMDDFFFPFILVFIVVHW